MDRFTCLYVEVFLDDIRCTNNVILKQESMHVSFYSVHKIVLLYGGGNYVVVRGVVIKTI